MYFTEAEERQFAVKPMNCPGHTFIYSSKKRSYRDLPLRIADFGRLHRYERSGVTAGLTRVRSFSQDDAHIFCAPEQIESEISELIKMLREVYRTFRFDELRVKLSTRPKDSIGNEDVWKKAEAELAQVLTREGLEYAVNAGDGAFYGPKIDFTVLDALRREWQLATIQLDFFLPERFDLHYTSAGGGEERPVMIHRAVLGSIERFMGILIEHYAGAFPFWFAPIQARVLPIVDDLNDYAMQVYDKLIDAGFRVDYNDRSDKIGKKIRDAGAMKIPYLLVVGKKEAEDGTVAPRLRDGTDLGAMPLDQLIAKMTAENDPFYGKKPRWRLPSK